MPNLCVLVQYLDLILEMTCVFFLITNDVHQANAGWLEIFCRRAYSANWTGYASFTSFITSHDVDPFFHWRRISHPFVERLRRRPPLAEVMIASFY